MEIIERSKQIHELNQKWWVDLQTGERLNRNVGEIICLIHSEISEYWHGCKTMVRDTHLITRAMWQVELADALIRVFDFLGGTNRYDHVNRAYADAYEWATMKKFESESVWTADAHELLSDWMEAERKGRESNELIAKFIAFVEVNCDDVNLDIDQVIDEKLEYNKHRADHQPENRNEEGGKKW